MTADNDSMTTRNKTEDRVTCVICGVTSDARASHGTGRWIAAYAELTEDGGDWRCQPCAEAADLAERTAWSPR